MSAVELKRIVKRYGQTTAVDGIDLQIPSGQLVTLLGPSGCGKTTTLRMIAGLEMATEGSILIGGQDVTRKPAADRDVSMVFQSYALFPHMSVLDNVAYGPVVGGTPKPQAHDRAKEGLQLVGLAGFEARLPSALSGGQQQRVALARALVLRPKVLLFDEPLSNLDARLRRKMREDIRRLQQKLGFSAVYVTHDQEEALAVSDEIVLMDKGQIAQQGAPRSLYEAPNSAFVAKFMGEANILSATAEQGGLRLQAAFIPMEVGAHRGDIKAAIRPHAFTVVPKNDQADHLHGVLRGAVYLGTHMEYEVETDAGPLFVIGHDLDASFAPGDPVSLRISAQRVMIVHA